MTALHWAALSGHYNTVDALVKSGADVNLKDVVSYCITDCLAIY